MSSDVAVRPQPSNPFPNQSVHCEVSGSSVGYTTCSRYSAQARNQGMCCFCESQWRRCIVCRDQREDLDNPETFVNDRKRGWCRFHVENGPEATRPKRVRAPELPVAAPSPTAAPRAHSSQHIPGPESVAAAIIDLKPRRREILKAHLSGKSFEEMARAFGSSAISIRSTLTQTFNSLHLGSRRFTGNPEQCRLARLAAARAGMELYERMLGQNRDILETPSTVSRYKATREPPSIGELVKLMGNLSRVQLGVLSGFADNLTPDEIGDRAHVDRGHVYNTLTNIYKHLGLRLECFDGVRAQKIEARRQLVKLAFFRFSQRRDEAA